jgi:hypothetical protein
MDRTLAGGLALKGDWDLGEDAWKTDMDLNLLKLSVIVGRQVTDRVSATPGAPVEGSTYIFKADHPTQPNKVAAFDDGAWVYLNPYDGLKLYCLADGFEYIYTAAGGWALVTAGMTTEQIQDMIAAFVVAGTNVTLTYNDAGDVLTIAAAGGGGGSTPWYWLPPLASRFALSNGGGAANMVLTDDTDAGLILEPSTFAAASALSHCFALEALASSAADWTLEVKFEGDVNGAYEYNGFAICLYESSTNKFILFGNRTFGSYRSTMVDYWNSASSFNSDQRTMVGTPYKFLRVVHTGGTYKFYISAAGKRFFQILSVADTAFLAGRADKVGFAMGSARNTDIYWQFAVNRYSLT